MRAGLIGLVSDYPALEQEQELSMSAVASSTAAGRRRVHRNRFQRMLNSSIGLKITMALTGVILSGFVLVHMLGNLQVYQGAEALDAYGKLLRKEPALLWAFRLVLLSAVGLHVWAYLALTRNNLRARPQAYQVRKYKASSFASRSMTLTGPLVLAFIIYHILHLTTGTVFPDFQEGAGRPRSFPGAMVRDNLHDPGNARVHLRTLGGSDRLPQVTLNLWMRSAPWNSTRRCLPGRSSRSGPSTSLT
jgi:succinate dehydrogenase/fumarate reductase cytochrome b subunit (b558 family)